MKSVSIITVVYNEELRIEKYLRSFLWSDDIIVVDKSSSDKTIDTIKKLNFKNVHLFSVPYTDSGIVAEIALSHVKNEWVMVTTASDLVDPELVDQIYTEINKPNCSYDAMAIPFAIYVFGIMNKKSPWFDNDKVLVYRKECLEISGKIHEEYSFKGTKGILHIKSKGYFYHLTHKTMESFLERHIRYTKNETEKYDDSSKAYKISFRKIIAAIKKTTFDRRTIFLGWDGMALTLAYISYYILEFLFVWQKFNGKGEEVYADLIESVLKKWKNVSKDKE